MEPCFQLAIVSSYMKFQQVCKLLDQKAHNVCQHQPVKD
jgi:hypothetical protein